MFVDVAIDDFASTRQPIVVGHGSKTRRTGSVFGSLRDCGPRDPRSFLVLCGKEEQQFKNDVSPRASLADVPQDASRR